MIVADASALLEVLLRTARAAAIESRLLRVSEALHAPHIIDLEIAQALRKYAASHPARADGYRQALTDWMSFQVTRHRHNLFLTRIWELRGNISAYDAAYVALAEALSVPLLTCDQRLARAGGHRAQIEFVVGS